jgi:hypothetical protein
MRALAALVSVIEKVVPMPGAGAHQAQASLSYRPTSSRASAARAAAESAGSLSARR